MQMWLAKIEGLQGWEALTTASALFFGTALAGLAVHFVLFKILGRLAASTTHVLEEILVQRWRRPCRWLFPLLAVFLAAPLMPWPDEVQGLFRHLLSLLLILCLAWLGGSTIVAAQEIVLGRYDMEVRDNLKARAVHTQLNVLVKIALVIIAVLAIATMLMTFERIRQVGVSILASAGVIGVIAGFAAQRSIATLFAGIQIAITQPIRLEDVVIVEGEWGWVEEITLTYVVVRIWDLRRLVLPITYFLEKPFQNWTRVSADILGTVYLYTDYTMPVEPLREELQRIVAASDLWDGKVAGVVVTSASEKGLEIRALVSARNSPDLWTLRCLVREQLVTFLQQHYPEALPRLRGELVGGEEQAASPSP